MEIDLSGRVALVTGGTRGVGLGLAAAFQAAGAHVVTCSRHEADGDHVIADVRDQGSVEELVSGIVERLGHLDVVVNNAGGSPFALAADGSSRYHSKIVELNLLAPLMLAQCANAVMQRQEAGGCIVNVSSVSALRPSPGTAAYGAAKAGLDSLTRTLAVEWAPRVRVNAMDVGLVDTGQNDLHYGGDEGVQSILRTIPMRRMASPRDIGNVAAFLASDLASYVSGATIEVHGGGELPAFLSAIQDGRNS